MCFGPSTLGAGAKNTSRIQNKEVYATLCLQVFQWAVRQSAEVENQLTSCERLLEYSKLSTEEELIACGRMGPCKAEHCIPGMYL